MNAALAYAPLALAIILEVIATSFLKRSEQFSQLIPSIIVVLCYAGSFYFLSLALRVIPIGIAYAIWSGTGIVLISLIGYLAFGQKLDWAAIIGIGFIITGVLIVNLFSRSIGH